MNQEVNKELQKKIKKSHNNKTDYITPSFEFYIYLINFKCY